ncbi:TPA: hypothetical protein O4F91_004413 [Vibrio alginolyticus]|nr:hypothetical protein [Vibrio alginolyticus]HCZ9057198.1 hypothetical protein [Vibrio alginolyticus]
MLIESLENIATAIESVQSNPFRDYILPVGSVLVSGAVGVFAAYYSVHKHESNKAAISNIEAVNSILLSTCNARENLIALKGNYCNQIDSHPINRLLVIPPIFFDSNEIYIDAPKLSFLHAGKTSRNVPKWLNAARINGMFKNYNFLLEIWAKRNELYEEHLLPIVCDKHAGQINHQELISELGLGKVAEISDVTEQAIMFTDDMLVEICCFLEAFSTLSKDTVNLKVSRRYREIFEFELPTADISEYAVDMLSLTQALDLSLLTKVLKVPKTEAEQRYQRLYLP